MCGDRQICAGQLQDGRDSVWVRWYSIPPGIQPGIRGELGPALLFFFKHALAIWPCHKRPLAPTGWRPLAETRQAAPERPHLLIDTRQATCSVPVECALSLACSATHATAQRGVRLLGACRTAHGCNEPCYGGPSSRPHSRVPAAGSDPRAAQPLAAEQSALLPAAPANNMCTVTRRQHDAHSWRPLRWGMGPVGATVWHVIAACQKSKSLLRCLPQFSRASSLNTPVQQLVALQQWACKMYGVSTWL